MRSQRSDDRSSPSATNSLHHLSCRRPIWLECRDSHRAAPPSPQSDAGRWARAPATPHHPASLRVIDPHIDRRTPKQRRFKVSPKHRLRRPHRVDRGPGALIRHTERCLRAGGVLSCHRRCGTLNLPGGRQAGALETGHRLTPVEVGLRHLESSRGHRPTASLLAPSGTCPTQQFLKQDDQSRYGEATPQVVGGEK